MHQRKSTKPASPVIPLSFSSADTTPFTRQTPPSKDEPPSKKYDKGTPFYRYYFLTWALGCICGRFSVILRPVHWTCHSQEVDSISTAIGIDNTDKTAQAHGFRSNVNSANSANLDPSNHEAERWASLSSYYPPPPQRNPTSTLTNMERFEKELKSLDTWRKHTMDHLFEDICRKDSNCLENNKIVKRKLYNQSLTEGYDANIIKGASLTRSPTGRNFGDFQVKVDDDVLSVRQITSGYESLFQKLTLHNTVSYLGVSFQQDPLDALAIGDLLWRLQPDLVIELGTSGGGSAFYFQHVMSEYNPNAKILTIDPAIGSGKGGVNDAGTPLKQWNDIQVRQHCPYCKHATERIEWRNDTFGEDGEIVDTGPIRFFRGLPTSEEALAVAREAAAKAKTVMVIEDSNHDYKVVLANIKMYHQFVTEGSYLLVQDTRMGTPHKAILHFLKSAGGKCFDVDKRWEYFVFSQHFDGFLRKRPGCK